MTTDSKVAPDENLLQLRRDAENRNERYLIFLGLLVGPLLMGVTWLLTGNIKAAKASGVYIFYIGSIVLVPTFLRYMYFSRKLKHVSQEYQATIQGVIGPVSKTYETVYDYSLFQIAEFQAYKKMHFWGTGFGFAIFAVFSWFYTNLFLNQFI
jgi:hypothetical protein